MKIFLDTTAINDTPLFNESIISSLLDVTNSGDINIYISDIVMYELRSHYIDQLNKEIASYNSSVKKINKILFDKYKQIELDKYDEIINYFDNNIKELENNKQITILEYEEVEDLTLKKLIEQYKNSKAPFHNSKDSWKDYIIWSTYSKEIKISKKEDKIIFISNNTNDFSNLDRNALHKDLLDEINNHEVQFYKTIKEFLSKCVEYYNIYKKYLHSKYIETNDIEHIKRLILFSINYVDKYKNKIQRNPNSEIHIKKNGISIISDDENYISFIIILSENNMDPNNNNNKFSKKQYNCNDVKFKIIYDKNKNYIIDIKSITEQ